MRKALWIGLALLLLAGCGRTKSAADLAAQLHDPDAALRLGAVRELRQREAADAVPALAGALKDESSFVRRDAAAALGGFGPEARPALAELLAARRDRERSVRRAAEDALKKVAPEAAGKSGR